MSTTQETFDSRDLDNEERPLDVSIGVVKRLLLFAYEHYNEAYKTNAISVMTADLLADLGALNFLDAADYAVGAENIYNDGGTRGAAVGQRSGNQITFRGLASVRQLRDGFPWYMPQDIFNTERIEFSRSPGGLSYGDVDAGGTVNVGTKRPALGRVAKIGRAHV